MNDINDNDEDVLDMTAINADIAAGARAYGELLKNVTEDWGRWTIIVRGLRALRDLAFAKAHTRDIKSWHYRQELSALLERRPYSVYSHIDKQTRSTCYKLMDRLDEICDWHKTLPANDQLRWKHPTSSPSTALSICLRAACGSTTSRKRPAKRSEPPPPKKIGCGNCCS